MTSQRFALLLAIVITICLDVSSFVATAAPVVWNPKTSRYVGTYNLENGPVFYEAYYPDIREGHQEKRYSDRDTVLETSFQVPLERFTYSETADRPVTINESFVVEDNEETLPREQRKAIESRRNYDAASFSDEHSTIFHDAKNSQATSIEEIFKLVKRTISRDLENWNALKGYLDRAIHQDRPMPQLGPYSREIYKNREDSNYMFPVNSRFIETDLLKRLEASSLQNLDARDAKQRPAHFEGVDASRSTMTGEMSGSGTQAVDIPPPIDVVPDSLPPENIFQPRPQLIRYTFFKRPTLPRLANEQDEKSIDQSTPRTYGDNLVREEIADDKRGRRVKENVKVTSIEISELPQHKTRHHHGEWPKRDYSVHHRSQKKSTAHP